MHPLQAPWVGAGLQILGQQRPARSTIACASAPPRTANGTTKRTVKQPVQTKTVRNTPTARGLETSGTGRKGSRFYFNFTGFPFPLGPFFERRTVRNEVVKGTIWTFEQTQALDFFDVYTPVRMTVIKLKSGGLWVHAPVAPTDECIRLLRELDVPVEYIVLPTFAYEHKIFVGPFSRKFPRAKVYTTPYQWSYPLNLPPQFFGIFPAGELMDEDPEAPWADEIQQKLLLPPPVGVSEAVRLTEMAFFHKASRTLMVTDAVVYVPDDPPEVIPRQSLLALAKDGFLARYLAGGRSKEEIKAVARDGPAEDTPEARRLGWQRMSLLVLYFNPSDLLTPEESWRAISNKLIVGPVVRTLVYDKIPTTTTDWVDRICQWRFDKVIPAHFAAPVRAGPSEFKAAFQFCYDRLEEQQQQSGTSTSSSSSSGKYQSQKAAAAAGGTGPFGGLFAAVWPWLGGGSGGKKRAEELPSADVKVLKELNSTLLKIGAVYPDAEERAAAALAGKQQRPKSR